MTTCTCGDMLKLAMVLADDLDATNQHMRDYDAHRATCATCQANEREAINVYKRLKVPDLTPRPQCADGCTWKHFDGVHYCDGCGAWYV